jgi:predicted DCC family thiol-disulfide oxidoreductase YuxK
MVPKSGWILYDGHCGFCTRWAKFWAPTLTRAGFAVSPLQELWVADRLKVPAGDLLSDIRLLTPENRLISGADVYLQAARRIWWAWPFYAVFSLPGFKWLIKFGYRWFAKNRYCISGACRLNPEH